MTENTQPVIETTHCPTCDELRIITILVKSYTLYDQYGQTTKYQPDKGFILCSVCLSSLTHRFTPAQANRIFNEILPPTYK